MLSEEQKFLLDLEGYIVLPGVLSMDEVDVLNHKTDQIWPIQKAPIQRFAAM